MARTNIVVQEVNSVTGLVNPTMTAAIADGHLWDGTGNEVVFVDNSNAGTIVATVQTPGTVNGLAIAELAISIPAGQTAFISGFKPGIFHQSDGNVYIDFDIQASVTFMVFRP